MGMPPDPLAIACFACWLRCAQHSYVATYILASSPADLPDQCKTASSTPDSWVCFHEAVYQLSIKTCLNIVQL